MVTVIAASAATANADATVTVALTPQGEAYASTIGISANDLRDQVKQRLDDVYQTSNISGFLRDFTDATSFSARGLGVDYGSTPTGLMFGIAANLAAAGDSTVFDDARPTAGLAANLGVMVGLNLSKWNLPKWSLYVNGFYRKGSTDQLRGNITSAGAHVQYRIIEATQGSGAGNAVRWLGVSATSGLEVSRWELRTTSGGIDTSVPITGSDSNPTLKLDSVGKFDLTSQAETIPVEVTTGFRIAVLASVYAGVGMDFTVGNSTVDANLNGELHQGTDPDSLGTVTIDGDGKGSASPAAPRALVGVQLNLTALRIFAQANLSATPAASVAFGLRLVF